MACLLSLAACGISNTSSSNSVVDDSGHTEGSDLNDKQAIQGTMQIKDTITVGDPVELKFVVINSADTVARFLKWSTPFEPLVSKYLDITDEDGTQVDYRGAMAKRAMPPSEESYVKLNPGDSLVVNVNLLEGYAISRAAKYKVVYVGEGMSGISVRDSVYFVYR
ncbi:protease [Daejeonella lutea]|nr:protease [Daejeonella lutea]